MTGQGADSHRLQAPDTPETPPDDGFENTGGHVQCRASRRPACQEYHLFASGL